MSQPKHVKLTETQSSLLTLTAEDILPDLIEQPEPRSVQALAFQHWDKTTGTELQVHVIVTRDKREFLEPFETIQID